MTVTATRCGSLGGALETAEVAETEDRLLSSPVLRVTPGTRAAFWNFCVCSLAVGIPNPSLVTARLCFPARLGHDPTFQSSLRPDLTARPAFSVPWGIACSIGDELCDLESGSSCARPRFPLLEDSPRNSASHKVGGRDWTGPQVYSKRSSASPLLSVSGDSYFTFLLPP